MYMQLHRRRKAYPCLRNSEHAARTVVYTDGLVSIGQMQTFSRTRCDFRHVWCSGDIFDDRRGPAFSFNHVTSPYGYTLADVVSYT